MKENIFNVIEGKKKVRSWNLSDRGRVTILNSIFVFQSVKMAQVTVNSILLWERLLGLIGCVFCVLLLLSNNNLLGVRRK